MNPIRLRLEWSVLLVLALVGALWGQWTQATYRFDNQMLDLASAMARPDVREDIFIVEIDDRALAEYGAWPWPRSRHAALIEQLNARGAKLIMMDILFVDPTEADQDDALMQAMAQADNVILPHSFGRLPNTEEDLAPVRPWSAFEQAAVGTGHVNAQPDRDGVLRRFALSQPLGDEDYPHFTVAALEALGQAQLASRWIGSERATQPMVPFNPEGSFRSDSAASVLSGSLVSGAIADKIVLVGATATGLGDRYSVPAGNVELMSGVETQANLLNAILEDRLVATVSPLWQGIVAALSLLFLFLAFWFLPPRFGLVCAFVMLAFVLGLSIALVPLAGAWMPVGSLALMILLAYPLWSWRRLTAVSQYLDNEAQRLIGPDRTVDDVEGVDFIARQVSRVRRLVLDVRDSLDFLRQVIEAAPDAILVLDQDGAAEMMNAQAQALFPDWNPDTGATLSRLVLDTRATLRPEQGELETADGKTFLIARAALGGVAYADRNGEIIALREVTEIRKREEERKQMLEFLSHDMRTPQVAIIGLAKSAIDGSAPKDYLNRVKVQAERTLKLADDFVQLARLEESSIIREDADLAALIEEACDRFYTPAKAKKIALAQALPDDPVFAHVDASLIARLLDNLIGNAIKYSPRETTITTQLERVGERMVKLTVADEGPGLPAERRSKPFARFGAHESHAGPSAGLGLAFVKRVVDAHGGTIAVTSPETGGTRFEVTLEEAAD